MRWILRACLLLPWVLMSAHALLAADRPVAVSPGSPNAMSLVESRCPTFSWAGVSNTKSYQLVVYQVEEGGGRAKPVIKKRLPASATSWTPAMDHCLDRGARYAWSIKAGGWTKGNKWSEPYLFQVAEGPSRAELSAALEIVHQYLSAEGDDSGLEGGLLWYSDLFTPTCENGIRYEDNGDGTVTDCRTGLIWLQDASCDDLGSQGNWGDTIAAVASLADGTCGLTDGSQAGFWRLPTITELMEMVASANAQEFDLPSLTNANGDDKWTTDGDAFIGVEFSCCEYWSSSEIDATSAWDVDIRTGNLDIDGKFERNWIWPVRSGLQVSARTATGSPNASCRDSELLVGGGCDCGTNKVAQTTRSTTIANSWVCKCDGSPVNGNATAICLINL